MLFRFNEQLNEQAAKLLEFNKFGLIFNYDLLGYGVMALSTFFTGLAMKPKNKTDKWLKALLMIHGVFYFSCTFMPITGMFAKMSSGGDGIGGRLALVTWCVYFLPVGILSFLHFKKDEIRHLLLSDNFQPVDIFPRTHRSWEHTLLRLL